ncbi:MAG: DHH family phosphoesterase [Ruminococcus sp.]|uniref:Cyclic-di-AMP phosphodiesterase n=1 Tax=Schaedlerella arabinosiphila TaxID=2044587 RepID=A0A3R8L2E6_9FIRM|nr:DHH family phosphoesterase [Schaedlerella arabinosiphila]MCI8723260.1 DHH family phosphoesterase [Ruminococcus sp.]MCI9212163.1 DHH family phosphoesterase [Ruminococcus sp.]MCI9633409.1 DHH family phosphoesterase [Ruminococcus sp.]RRK33578.1 DHH family phosphoesterase [Schaedlerella arabinosiphila]
MKKKDVRLKGQLKMYMRWPIIMTVLLIAMNIWMYKIDRQAAGMMSVFVIIYAVIVGILYFHNRSLILADMIQFSTQYKGIQNTLLRELAIPYAILMEDGRIVWKNDRFEEVFCGKRRERYLNKLIPEISRSIFPGDDENAELEIQHNGRDYQVHLSKVSMEGFSEAEDVLHIPREKEFFVVIYMTDVTELNANLREIDNQRMIAGLIYIDNYDEIMDSVEEVRQSLLVALIDRKINKYINDADGLVKKMEKDKYFIVIKKEAYQKFESDRFSLLEDVKQVNIGNARSATLSIGLGVDTSTYAQSYDYARMAIDLALARGGDQAVVKDCHGLKYYGGKKEQTSKNTRVKARVKAEALREFIIAKDQVFVMGHRLADADSLGACMGIYRAAKELGKKAHVVLEEVSNSIRPLYDEILDSSAYESDIFLTPGKALERINENSMVVVVDTNKPPMTECPELLKCTKTIAVLDHHRQGSIVIENAVLSYVEPYSSSTCEMVAEVLQYIVDDLRIPSVEADCLYAGIMIDTRNFMNRTGVRTFEAAAFLRRCGADITRVRKMFRDDMESYRAKAETVRLAEVYRSEYAIAECPGDIDSPTVLGAQAANELLDISGIKASFVLTIYNGRIYLSARSIDEVNVQIIAEKLGGGGHINAAGVQFDHTDVKEAIRKLKETIDQMIEAGDI